MQFHTDSPVRQPSEQSKRFSDRMIVAIVITAFVVVVLSLVWAFVRGASASATTGFTNGYTNQGGCLHGTAYDPAKGAAIHDDTINGQTIVTVVPASSPLRAKYVPLSFFAQNVDGAWYIKPVNDADFESVVGSSLCVNNPSINK